MIQEPSQIASIGRALAILDLLSSESREFGVTEVSDRLGLSKPVVSRILAVLAEEGEVIRNDKSGQFSLSLKRPLTAIQFLESMGSQARWLGVLKDIVAQVGELTELSLFHAGKLSCVASLEPSNQVLRVSSTLGHSPPLHATATGKAWLSCAPRSIAVPLLLKDGLRSFTPRTITSLDDLLRELDVIRRRGYATARREFDEGAVAVAAPVRLGPASEWLVGSLAIACPPSRGSEERLRELGLTVMLAAHRLARQWPASLAGPFLLPAEDSAVDGHSGEPNPHTAALTVPNPSASTHRGNRGMAIRKRGKGKLHD